MNRKEELYRQLLKEKSEANLKYIGKSLEEMLADEFDHLAEEAEGIESPKTLDAKLAALLQEEGTKGSMKERRRKLSKLARVSACILAVVLLGTGLVWKVDAFREKVYEIFYVEKPDYVEFKQVEIPYDKDGIIQEDWDGFWYPEKLTEGYSLADYTRNDQAIDLIFKNEEKEMIFFSQVPTRELHLLVDNEDQNLEEIEIASGAAFWRPGEGGNLLMWNKGETFFLLSSGLSKKDMVAIAENIVYRKGS